MLDNPSTSQCRERYDAHYVSRADQFILKQKVYARQYYSVYASRLKILGDKITPLALEKWGSNLSIKALSDLREEEPEKCIILGTFYKQQRLKPSILVDVSEENQLIPQPPPPSYVDESDRLILQDDVQRIRLRGKIDVHKTVTGVVCAVLGYADGDGLFQVEDIFYYESGPQRPLTPLSKAPRVAFISGLNLTSSINSQAQLDLLKFYLAGNLGMGDEESIVRLVIAGNSIMTKENLHDQLKDTEEIIRDIKEFDSFLDQLIKIIPIDLMPGELDLTNYALPQQGIPQIMLPKSHGSNNLHSVANPHAFEVDGRLILGTSGEPIQAIMKSSKIDNPLECLRQTLKWSHIAPLCPDTLPCYPYYEEDPFVILERPHVFFAGNCDQFKTDLAQSSQGSTTRLICIPRFSETKSIVLLNLATLECEELAFSADF